MQTRMHKCIQAEGHAAASVVCMHALGPASRGERTHKRHGFEHAYAVAEEEYCQMSKICKGVSCLQLPHYHITGMALSC